MSFELESVTKAKVSEVFVLSQKNRAPDEDPGAKLSLQALVGNDVLSTVDGTLKGWLFTRDPGAKPSDKDKQATLDGVPVVSDMPNLTNVGAHLKKINWVDKLTGYHLTIHFGIGGRSNIVVDDCTLTNLRFYPQQPGTVLAKFDVESPNVSEKTWGRLAKLKKIEVDIVLIAPTVDQQQPLDDEKHESWPFGKKPPAEGPPQSATVEHLPTSRKAEPDPTGAFLAAQEGQAS